jgi:transcription antitermination factor NusG
MGQDLWYALKVRSRSEWRVESNLRNKGYELFLPTYKSRRRWSYQIKTLELPLFPGYLFCRLDAHQRLPILTTPGVAHIVGIGKTPEPILESEIEAIRALVRSDAAYEPCPYVRVGQSVHVEFGSLCGLTGLVTHLRGKSRLIISVEILMRSVSVEIDEAWIRPTTTPLPQRFLSATTGVMLSAQESFSELKSCWP